MAPPESGARALADPVWAFPAARTERAGVAWRGAMAPGTKKCSQRASFTGENFARCFAERSERLDLHLLYFVGRGVVAGLLEEIRAKFPNDRADDEHRDKNHLLHERGLNGKRHPQPLV